MNETCECRYCKAKVDEYFCSYCLHKFNECESKFTFQGMICPKCHPNERKQAKNAQTNDERMLGSMEVKNRKEGL